MSKLYIIGGWIGSNDTNLGTCYTYDINSNTWNKIADLNIARDCASCTVFEDKVVVTGGVNNWYDLKSVEAYDYHENKWTFLPDMIKERYCHAAVSMGNKMFIVGGNYTTSCEVFDSRSRKFTTISSEIISALEDWCLDAFSIGNKIVMFHKNPHTESAVYLYEVDKEKWSNVEWDFTKNMSSFVKYYT